MKDDVSHMNVLGRPVLHAVGISKQIPVMPEPEYVAVTDLKIYRAFVFRVNVTHQIHNAGHCVRHEVFKGKFIFSDIYDKALISGIIDQLLRENGVPEQLLFQIFLFPVSFHVQVKLPENGKRFALAAAGRKRVIIRFHSARRRNGQGGRDAEERSTGMRL